MTKKYVTTVTTEWEVRGNVTPEMINKRVEAALRVLMMTDGEDNYAFTGGDHLLKTKTLEVSNISQVPNISQELHTEVWGALYTQAQGMDSDFLCEYYADHEVGQYQHYEAGALKLIQNGKENN